MRKSVLLLLAGAVSVICALVLLSLPPAPFVDEPLHHSQITAFAKGDFSGVFTSLLSMLPGYHALLAAAAWAVGDTSLPTLRFISALLCLPSIALFFLCARELRQDYPAEQTLLFFLCPIIFPFFFLLYTDVASLTVLLGSLLLALNRRYQLAGLAVLLAILMRQQNIVWACFIALLALEQESVIEQLARRDWRRVLCAVAKLWVFIFAALAFAAFVYWNDGAAVGKDRDLHALGRVYFTQGYLLLFSVFFLCLPLHLHNTPRTLAMLRCRPALYAAIAIGLWVLYVQTFWAEHRWNIGGIMIRNRLLAWLRQGVWHQSLAFVPMLWAAFSLCTLPLAHRAARWLYPLALIAVLPAGLIEPRYFIVAVMFFLLFVRWENRIVLCLTLLVCALASAYTYNGIITHAFFP